jgi:spore maturation protein CgeB
MPARRILIPGELSDGASAVGIADGLTAAGHAVTLVNIRDFFPWHRNRIVRAWRRLRTAYELRRYRQTILETAKTCRAEILLTLKGSYLDPAFLDQIRAMGIKIVMLYPDLHFRHNDFQPDWIGHYDLFVTTKSFHLPYLETVLPPERIAYLPHGYSPAVHTPDAVPATDDTFEWDVCYAGNSSPDKQTWVRALLERVPEAKTLIIGAGWDGFSHPSATIVGPVTGRAYAAAIARSRINVAVHWGTDPVTGMGDLVSTRSFEIPACGGFMLHIDNDEVRSFYSPGSECDVFDTPDMLAEKVRHYLAHPDQRMKIAAAGCARAVPAYSYHTRGEALASLIEKRLFVS